MHANTVAYCMVRLKRSAKCLQLSPPTSGETGHCDMVQPALAAPCQVGAHSVSVCQMCVSGGVWEAVVESDLTL